MTTTILLAAFLVVPGVILCAIIRTKELFLIKSIIFSYALFILNVFIVEKLSSNYQTLSLFYYLEISCGLITLVVPNRWQKSYKGILSVLTPNSRKLELILPYVWVFIGVFCWLKLVGAYLEIPADVFQHLGKIHESKKNIELGSISTGNQWYELIAYCMVISKEKMPDVVLPYSIAMTTLFLFSLMSVAESLAKDMLLSKTATRVFVIGSPILTVLAFGTSVFSYVRYYVFAPSFVCYPIYIACAYLIVRYTLSRNSSQNPLEQYLIVLVGIVITYITHRQEALYIVVVLFGCLVLSLSMTIGQKRASTRSERLLPQSVLISLIVVTVVLFMFYLINRTVIETGLLENNVISLGSLFSGRYRILIADPFGRVYETLGLWGVLLIFVYVFWLPKTAKHWFFSCLILFPLLVLFCPFAIDIFLQVSKQELLWRFMYMIPSGLLGAYVLAHFVGNYSKKTRSSLFVGLVLIATLFPAHKYHNYLQQRYSTLGQVRIGNSSELWKDLVFEIGKNKARNVLTDPVTGYVLRALTNNKYYGFKFHGTGKHISINHEEYGHDSFAGYTSWLFVVNRRDGSISRNGGISGHWPSSVTRMSNYYSKELISFLAQNPSHFKLIWEEDSISVYEIDNTKISI